MILDKEVEIKNNYRIKKRYEMFGLDVSKEFIKVPIEMMSSGSHVIITSVCDICKFESKMMFKTYVKQTEYDGINYCEKCSLIKKRKRILEKYGVENYTETPDFKSKSKKTCQSKYGRDFFQSTEEYKNKIKETCQRKYGVNNYANTYECQEKMKKTRIENKNQINDKKKTEFNIYRDKVRRETKKYKIMLFENWNGFDFYDGEYINNYRELHHNDKNYPTIDHKISIYQGFINNLSIEDVSNIFNLCITKRCINSRKNNKSYYNLISK
jgi:hypothetical protein